MVSIGAPRGRRASRRRLRTRRDFAILSSELGGRPAPSALRSDERQGLRLGALRQPESFQPLRRLKLRLLPTYAPARPERGALQHPQTFSRLNFTRRLSRMRCPVLGNDGLYRVNHFVKSAVLL